MPDVLASAISVIGSGGGTNDGQSSKKKALTAADPRDQNKVEKLRGELDDLVAAGCPLCEVREMFTTNATHTLTLLLPTGIRHHH